MTDKKIKIEQCTFAYQCPKSWDQLFRTNVDSVRFCDQCEKNVYLSNSSTEALEHASKGECVAIPIELTREAKQALDSRNMVVGMMGPPPDGPLSPGKENIEDLYVRSVDRPAEFYGIDGCPTGWFYVGIDIKGECQFGVLEKYSDIGLFARRAKLTLVDIPIGLPSSVITDRLCDKAARKVITPRGSSVFPAPARAALLEHSYIEGSEANRRAVGKKLSKQSWNIVPKIREVDDYMRSQDLQARVREMHPEVAFWALNDCKPLHFGKKKQEGAQERLEILTRFLPFAEDCYKDALNTYKRKDVAADDILDAMVGAVTAMHLPGIKTLPESPIMDEEGLAMEIVYASI